jgi:hypothetical protein
MKCDDCGCETSIDGNHPTDAACLDALLAAGVRKDGLLRRARNEIQNNIAVEVRDCPLYDEINAEIGELA